METLSFWLYILFFFTQCQTGLFLLNNSTSINHLCRQDERQLLVQLKQQLPPVGGPQSNYKTTYWSKSRDCCLWDGVACDESTGHVIGLDLSSGGLTGNVHSNSSLFGLTHLQKLNLARNYFDGSEISFKFGQLSSLTHLNLSESGFSGRIPLEFYHLSNMISLHMNIYHLSVDEGYDSLIYCDIKMLLGNMTKIRVLFLPSVNLSSEMPINVSSFLTHLDLGRTGIPDKLPETIFEKPNLQVLRLYGNPDLVDTLPKSFNRSNVHSIMELNLSETSISGRLPESLGFTSNLNSLSLSNCKFSGPLPESIGNITGIKQIILNSNNFSGQVPSTISNLRHLTYLDLSWNHLEGQIPSSFSNMSQLEKLINGSNALTGAFPSKVDRGLQKLSHMDLSSNSIQGTIPSWLLSLPPVQFLDLSFNRLTGPTGEFNCRRLQHLDLSNNQLNIELESFYNLPEIGQIFLSHNTVTEHGHKVVNVTLPNLRFLELSSCEIREFPDFLRNLSTLASLDLSNNKIHGPIPRWLSSLPLEHLNLSTNYLTNARYLPWPLGSLDLQYNLLQGTFPSSICNVSDIVILILSNNKMSGKIPDCIGSISPGILDFRRNEFHGKIPATIGSSCTDLLFSLQLNENNLEGPLPRSLANCNILEVLDLGNNKIHDTFPGWIQTLPYLRILILNSNSFHGSIKLPILNNSFPVLQIIDLSSNNFTGLLPENLFASLQAMEHHRPAPLYLEDDDLPFLYQVTVSVKGEDVELIKVLSSLTTVDLSCNNFHGPIPESITGLYALRLLNLSHNLISGSIPPALGRLIDLEQLDLSSNQFRRIISSPHFQMTHILATQDYVDLL